MIKEEMLKEILAMSSEDLATLNHYLVGILKQNHRIESSSVATIFRPGDRVSFSSEYSGTLVGRIVKVKTLKAIIRIENSFSEWDVPLRLLAKVTE